MNTEKLIEPARNYELPNLVSPPFSQLDWLFWHDTVKKLKWQLFTLCLARSSTDKYQLDFVLFIPFYQSSNLGLNLAQRIWCQCRCWKFSPQLWDAEVGLVSTMHFWSSLYTRCTLEIRVHKMYSGNKRKEPIKQKKNHGRKSGW